MFTIENHLEELSRIDEKCKTIYSIWNLNKQNLKRALSTIQISFPHYSIHDYSHADTIIQNIELYLGKDRIDTLSVTDSWLILMSAYTHDIGMIVFMKDLEAKLNTPTFLQDLRKKANNRYDLDLAEAAQTILELLDPRSNQDTFPKKESFNISFILKIKKSITLLSAELFRKIHHEKSKTIITGIDESFANEFNKFYSSDIPIRFLQILGDIAYSHGIGFYETLDLLPQKSNGYASDYMHPRFIACMLRLGDLLDVDDKRFNQFTTKVFDKEKVQLSGRHEQKHASIKHLLVTPESIEVTVDCKEDETVFRIANQWFDFLKKEIEHQNREWSNIRPASLTGLSPSFSRDKIQVLFNGKTADTDLMNLQFNISKEKTFEIFEGSALYDDPSYVFLREITQNAVDATKIQLWKDIEKGVYDFLLKQNLHQLYDIDTESWDHKQVLENIKFPIDIPEQIYDNYDILLSIGWEVKDYKYLTFEIIDKGCGISKSTLLRMSRNVGDSRKNDISFQELKKRMPFFLKPTGAFGLGLQSIFLITDEFEVNTKNEDDGGWNIIFRSAKNDEYISVNPLKHKINTGTHLKIIIPEKKVDTIFFTRFDLSEVYDHFTDPMGGKAIWNIIFFAQEYLLNQKFLKLYIQNELIPYNKYQPKDRARHDESKIISFERLNKPKQNKETLITFGIYKLSKYSSLNAKILDTNVGFKIFERLSEKSGSEINLIFSNSLPTFYFEYLHSSSPSFTSLYSVRDIKIIDYPYNFVQTIFCKLNINLLNPESDKILNIARSKLIYKAKEEFNKIFLTEILPQILPDIKSQFENNFDQLTKYNSNNISAEIIYFHIQLTFLLNNLDDSDFDVRFYNEYLLPEVAIASYSENFKVFNAIPIGDFFKQQKIYINNVTSEGVEKILKTKGVYDTLENLKQAYIDIIAQKKISIFENVTIIWYSGYFYNYLKKFYKISSFVINDLNIILGKELILSKTPLYNSIKIQEEEKLAFYSQYLYSADKLNDDSNRRIFYAIEPYAGVLAVKKTETLHFATFPIYADHGIISPFKNFGEFENLRNEVKDLIDDDNYIKIKEILVNKYIDEFINIKLIKFIIENSSVEKNDHNKKTIKESYADFIVETLRHSKKFNKNTFGGYDYMFYS